MTTTLPHVNVVPAQTWNYLHVNDVSFELAELEPSTQTLSVPTNLGYEADGWVIAHAGELHHTTLGNGDELDIQVSDYSQAHELHVKAGAHAAVHILAMQAPEPEALGCVLSIEVGAGAHLDITGIYDCADVPFLGGVSVTLDKGATLELRQFSLSGRRSALGFDIHQAGEGSSVVVANRYLVGEGELLDMTCTCRMSAPDTTCNMSFSGVLGQGASKCLRDTIDLMHGAKGASGLESETVLLAGGQLVNKSLPTILCDEDDVAGDHGATIGSISPEQLAYLANRGLTSDDVVALYTQAVLEDALGHAKGKAREATFAAATRILGNELASVLSDESEQ